MAETLSNYLLADIEVYPNYFEVGVKDFINKTVITFEVDEKNDQRNELYSFLTTYKGYWITFNGIHYDNVVLAYFVKEFKSLLRLSRREFCAAMKAFSNLCIQDDHDRIKWYKWYKHGWVDIDLFLYWAKSLRISKKISLKSLGIQLNHPRVQELPYPHDTELTSEQRAHVKDYNIENDLVILETLCTRMSPDIQLRKYIFQEYGLSCWSMDAPKITSEYLLNDYCQKTWDNQGKFEDYKREVRSSRYIPKPWKIGDYLPPVNFKTKFFQDLDKEIRRSDNTFSKEFYYENGLTKVVVSIGIGGIHVLNQDEWYESTDDILCIDQDVASLYPQLLDNHKFIRKELAIVLDRYLGLKLDRIDAKRSGNKTKDIFLKLCLNGFTGIADSNVTWLYSPEHLLALRVYGQLIQLRVMEELSEIGIRVVSNNTDGTTALVPKHLLDAYHKINNDISKEFNITWEYCIIDKIVYTNVNNYICFISKEYMVDEEGKEINVKEKTKTKKKGFYKYGSDIPLGDSVNEQVVAKALELYWSKGIPVRESISNPEEYGFHIYDYCKSNKIDKSYEVYHNNQKVQNLNRYYFQKTAPLLFKKKKVRGSAFENINAGEGVCLFNNYQEKSWEEYNINYSHYIKKAATIIDNITNKQLSLF
jgi:hypothetical protein